MATSNSTARPRKRLANRLSQRKCATAPPGKYGDGESLWLYVKSTGRRTWVLRVEQDGTRRELGLGAFPGVSLAKARSEAERIRKAIVQGEDPLKVRDGISNPDPVEPVVPTFTQVAAAYIRAHRRSWANRKHQRQWVSTLKTYARPVIGALPVEQVTTEHMLKVLTPIWHSRTETAKRLQGRIENILDFAAARKWRDPLNPARWRGHLDKLLPRPTKLRRVVHHPAMPYTEVPAFMAELGAMDSISARALELLVLTATRTSEVLGASWNEFDLDAGTWTIPASRMKARREHRVPLSDAALAVLERVPRVVGNPYTFTGARRGRPLSNMALLQLMRGMGYGVVGTRGAFVPHGFRSSFRDWSGEASSFPRDVCEMALAHVVENRVEAAYRRGDLFVKRASMMQAWADWCASIPAVVQPLRAEAHNI